MKKLLEKYDLAVIGAGPAGAYLARKAALGGMKVALLDHKAPWNKPCGGGITHKAWSAFPALVHPDLPRHEVFKSLQISSTGRFFVIDEGHPLFMVSRFDLSEMMLNQAVAAGVTHFNVKVTELKDRGGVFRVYGAGLILDADFVAGADGVMSVVRRRLLGKLPVNRTLPTVYQLFEGGPDDPTMIQVTSFPGYVWAFAHPTYLSVGVGAMEHGHKLKPELTDFMGRFFPGRKPLTPPKNALLPYMGQLGAYTEPRVGKNWGLVGDAAGFCDTMTGEGILYAVWSADLLGDAILKGRPESYDRAWKKAFGFHLLTGAILSRRFFSTENLDLFFTALTVCPAPRKIFLDFIWNQPPYHKLFTQFVAALPKTIAQWRKFKAKGGQISPNALGIFKDLADKLTLKWD